MSSARNVVASAVLVVTATAACSMEPGSGLCVPTTATPSPATVTAQYAPLSLRAKLSAAAAPVVGASLAFYVRAQAPAEKPKAGFVIGSAKTGPDGTAVFVRAGGTDGLALPGERLVSFEVQFAPADKIGGTQYCESRGDAPIAG